MAQEINFGKNRYYTLKQPLCPFFKDFVCLDLKNGGRGPDPTRQRSCFLTPGLEKIIFRSISLTENRGKPSDIISNQFILRQLS